MLCVTPPAQRTLVVVRQLPTSVERCQHGVQNLGLVRGLMRRYRSMDADWQERVMFVIATLLGTLLFFILFEALYRFSYYSMEHIQTAFTVSYMSAYLISIIWQHALNRCLLPSFSYNSYWTSLLQTYVVYSFSLGMMTVIGAAAIRWFAFHPRTVTAISLPSSGVLNYLALQFLFRSWSAPATSRCNAKLAGVDV